MMDWMKICLCAILLAVAIEATVWDSQNYPNPTTQAGAKQCGLRSAGQLCDPDNVLSEQERYRINHELSRLESKTYQEFGRNFCEKKGLTAVVGLAKNVKGGTESDVRKMATDLRQRWSLDQQCMKGLVLIISVDDKKFWVSRDNKVPVYAGEFSDILNAQTSLFRDKDYPQALINIIQETTNKAAGKQGQLPATPVDEGRDRKPSPGPVPSGGGGLPFKMPSIPTWLILLILLVVVPSLICCCCICYCCFRSKGNTTRRQGPSDVDTETGGQVPPGQRTGGGMGDRFRGILSGGAAGAAVPMIQNWFRNRRSGGGAVPPPTPGDDPANRGGYVPPRPQADEGKGLYPSVEVKDQGAGGSW